MRTSENSVSPRYTPTTRLLDVAPYALRIPKVMNFREFCTGEVVRGIRLLRRWVNTECTWVLGEPRGPATEMRISPEQTRAQVEPAGFLLEKVANLPPYHYGAVFVRLS
jgi:hypothetical protein